LRADTIVVVLAVGALSAAMVAPEAAGPWALAALVAGLLFSIERKQGPAIDVALFALLWVGTAVLFPASRVWPAKLLAPLAVYLLIAALLRRPLPWLRAGRLNAGDGAWIAATAVVSSAALLVWVRIGDPDLGVHLANMPDMPLWLYPLAAAAFAFGNAAIEEAAFRGIVMDGLDRTVGANAGTVGIQAICFAAAHYADGFPRGAWGFAMVVVYGAMLGAIRNRSGGLLAAWIAHVAADLTIFAIVAAVLNAG
jgi:membrane protease YdiL (CAAX protease family)